MIRILVSAFLLCTAASVRLAAQTSGDRFEPLDVFELERVVDPQISPDGRQIVYVRSSFDIMTDRARTALWIVNRDGTGHRPLKSGSASYSQPRWSSDGTRLAFVSNQDDRSQVYVRWMDTGQEAKLTNLTQSPGGISWSPDGNWLAFSMFVPGRASPLSADLPTPPEGADWGPSFTIIDDLNYRADGEGYVKEGYNHLFVLPADGGTPRQITTGPYNHGGARWTPDGTALIFSANRHENRDLDPRNSDIYEVAIADGSITQLTDRQGPDGSPRVSPDGRLVAYTGFDDRLQGYQVTRLYVMNRDGSDSRLVTGEFDRDVQNPTWSRNGRRIFFQYDDQGTTYVASVSLNGEITQIAENVGGLSLGRPYSGGRYSLSGDDWVAYTHGTADHPADLAVARAGRNAARLTRLNEDLLGHKELGAVEEIWWESSYDGRRIQGWIVKPPGFDSTRQYPLILEIHGGPFANYGDRFAAEIQLYAAQGYVVLYTNPRGSTSYGEEFGNLIHHAYPGNDYDDLMSGVDAVLERGYVDAENLFVTGGSGGGVLSAWIVGKTDRFRAAAVQKPVINWYSFVLYSDGPGFFYKYWFPGLPWEYQEQYMARSPISLVGNVTTPTMLITGERDHRTPIAETEQYYAALKILGVEAVMVRVPDASHGIAARPSNLIAKVQYILAWFEKFRTGGDDMASHE
ncbi:MAG: S9 family peptidase [Gemmatimonadetes bacterium]|nr:S9 family peptidase [Gemmatimonadota bacterium]